MITDEEKIIVESIWKSFFEAGYTDNLSIIEQSVYLIILYLLDEEEFNLEQIEKMSGEKQVHIFSPEQQKYRWHIFKDFEEIELFNLIKDHVFLFVKSINHEDVLPFSNLFQNASLTIPKANFLKDIIVKFNQLFTNLGADFQNGIGEIYNIFLSKIKSSSDVGLYRTPKHICDLMVSLIEPQTKSTICDPACGTGGFLVSSAEYIRNNYESSMNEVDWNHFSHGLLTGFDNSDKMIVISSMNLILHSIQTPNIVYQDSVSKTNTHESDFDIVFSNPPFKGNVNNATLSESIKNECNGKKPYQLFLTLFIRMLKKGGRCACLVPDGLLFGQKGADKELRKKLIEEHQLNAVIHLPKETSGSGTSTAILIFTKTGAGGTDKVWFYDIENDGYSLDDKRIPIEENDIPDVIQRFKNLCKEDSRTREEKSFFVPISEIIANNYDLSINKYKKIKYEKIEYPSSEKIMSEIRTLYSKIGNDLDKIDKVIKKITK